MTKNNESNKNMDEIVIEKGVPLSAPGIWGGVLSKMEKGDSFELLDWKRLNSCACFISRNYPKGTFTVRKTGLSSWRVWRLK